jgi:hypothetical protein
MNATLGGLESYLSNVNAISDIRAHAVVMNMGFNKVFFNFSETDFFIKKLSKYNDFMKFYESGGSASTLALSSAVKMGFKKIVLAGIDLAFKDNVIYANGETMQRISQDEITVNDVKKNLVQVKSVTGGLVYTRDDYESFIQHFAVLIKELNFLEIYNISSFGAMIPGTKSSTFDDLVLDTRANMPAVSLAQPFKFNIEEFMKDEFYNINNIISMLSKGVFSPALVSSIVKSVLVYQYMQAEILTVLQKNFDPEMAQKFIDDTKVAIKNIVEQVQKYKLI